MDGLNEEKLTQWRKGAEEEGMANDQKMKSGSLPFAEVHAATSAKGKLLDAFSVDLHFPSLRLRASA